MPKREESLAQHMYSILSSRIHNFQLNPGERLTEARLSREFNVSRTPVREALRLLRESGLVVPIDGSRGYMVRSLDLSDVEKLYCVRKVLEILAVELSARNVHTKAFLRFVEEVKTASEHATAEARTAMREEFHERLASFSDNVVLCKFLKEINNRIYWTRRLDFNAPHRFREAQLEHYKILRFLVEGQIEEAKALMNKHISASEAAVEVLIREGHQLLVITPLSKDGR
jgi:DNA-binding GntR family transcriptional regulator